MDKVNSIQEAMIWFLANSSGSVKCINDNGKEKICNCFLDAKEFYL